MDTDELKDTEQKDTDSGGVSSIGSQDASSKDYQDVSFTNRQDASSAQAHSDSLAGLGVDIVEIARMENILKRTPRFKQRVFVQSERDYCESKPNPAVHYALFFAAKEAVLKALGTGFAGMGLNDVQVAHDGRGKPLAVLQGKAKQVADDGQIAEVFLSLSYTHKTAVASAVAARKENIPPKQTAEDPNKKIEAQFRNMRAMLDEIDAKLTEIEESREA